MSTLSKNYKKLVHSQLKDNADSKYDNKFAVRAIPDYEPLTVVQLSD